MSLGDVTSMRAGVLERLGGIRADVVWIGLIFLSLITVKFVLTIP